MLLNILLCVTPWPVFIQPNLMFDGKAWNLSSVRSSTLAGSNSEMPKLLAKDKHSSLFFWNKSLKHIYDISSLEQTL